MIPLLPNPAKLEASAAKTVVRPDMKKIPDVQATGIHVAVPVAFHRLPREPVSRHATLVKSLELIAS